MDSRPDHRSSSVMGYPSVNGYPNYPNGRGKPPPPPPPPYAVRYQGGTGYTSPYHSYHNPPPTANPKDFSSGSFTMWYNSDKIGQWEPEPTNTQKMARLMFVTTVTLLISMCMVSLVVWLLYGTDVPEFQVASLSVSNLTVSGSTIQASWAANITVTNPNSRLRINSGEIKASLLYKDYPLAMSSIEPSYSQGQIQGENQVNMFIKMEHQESIFKSDVASEIIADQKTGTLVVSMRLLVGSKISSQTGWNLDTLRICCEDLKILVTPEGEGELAEDSPNTCLMFA